MALNLSPELNRVSTIDRLQARRVDYYKFPDNPTTTTIEGYNVLEYIPQEIVMENIKQIAELIDPNEFDAVVVNETGGIYLYKLLSEFNPEITLRDTFPVNYKRAPGGYNSDVIKPIPESIRGTKTLLIEDIYDTGGTIEAIKKHSPDTVSVVAVQKAGILNQIALNNIFPAVITDDVWLGGVGMDFGTENYPIDFPRDLRSIVVMP